MDRDKAITADRFEQDAEDVARVLRPLANARRLMIVCKLTEWGEGNVSDLAAAVGISQSALSQHLALLRTERIVAFRRDRQTLWYRVSDPRIESLLATLHGLFCNAAGQAASEPKDT